MGLAPSNQRSNSKLFIDELYSKGIISDRIFSFYITQDTDSSVATFGGYNLDVFAGGNKTITWNSLINTNYWTVGLVSVKIGARTITTSVD